MREPIEPTVERTAEVLPFPSDRRRDATGSGPTEAPGPAEPRLRDVIGDVLRDERREQERTLADVAEQAAVSLPYLSEVERGTKEVSSDLLAAICDALDLPLDVLLERSVQRLRPRAGGRSGTVMLAA